MSLILSKISYKMIICNKLNAILQKKCNYSNSKPEHLLFTSFIKKKNTFNSPLTYGNHSFQNFDAPNYRIHHTGCILQKNIAEKYCNYSNSKP